MPTDRFKRESADSLVIIAGQVEGTELHYKVSQDDEGRLILSPGSDSSPVRTDLLALYQDQILDADPVAVASNQDGLVAAPINCRDYRFFALSLQIISAGTPTDIEFFVEFSPDGGTVWTHYAQGLFASLVYDDTDVASVKNQIFDGICAGETFRLRVVAVGTDANNTFTFTAHVQFWR